MADWFQIHPVNPQQRLLAQIAVRVRQGAVIAYPTDSCYALGCQLDDRGAAERLRRIRDFDRHHQFTLVCRDLSEIATYAKVDNRQFRLIKSLTPGPYTFVLMATKELPRRVAHEKRKTVGIRVPGHVTTQALLETLGEPLISCTLQFPGEDLPVGEPEDWREQLDRSVDIVIDGGPCGVDPTTVLDLSEDDVSVVRRGKGDLERIGL
ncbi:MAG: L-threonylcarbamoyladenylate synthase [Sinimarinibacterium flocculans]|uniref:tRNA threonylcarbamoyl adenosine modification protein (Sua5/YciO/YrdC/YwlC family) n=1 Tax=Sinimarinibacterium flocculans TaxID=985250 RepID=A0A318EF00_9GAMM|nr:L-threonylcarbamoyladenylate synthase [Sinimarinibacterium flocculans]MEC9364916.1 L-threonylcarbamoyladenylate synthase [Pseudomonadota bacterium]PXV71367.1 tRNA threonylcarbamoyl adenosine modification protein (Sua5/YciO/YrdC/YwlC family) [Sinimarinibacterium flocculans]